MERDKIRQYLQICKKYNYDKILTENVDQNDKNIIAYIKSFGKLEEIFNKYHEMKSGGGSGGKGAKSKFTKNKKQNKKIHKNKDYEDKKEHNSTNNSLLNVQHSTTQNKSHEEFQLLKLEILNEIETQLTLEQSKLSILLKHAVEKIINDKKK